MVNKSSFLIFVCAEVNLQHSAIWMAGVYLMLLMQFLENKVAVDLTRSEFVEAQEVCGMHSLMVFFKVPHLFILLFLWFVTCLIFPICISLCPQSCYFFSSAFIHFSNFVV